MRRGQGRLRSQALDKAVGDRAIAQEWAQDFDEAVHRRGDDVSLEQAELFPRFSHVTNRNEGPGSLPLGDLPRRVEQTVLRIDQLNRLAGFRAPQPHHAHGRRSG